MSVSRNLLPDNSIIRVVVESVVNNPLSTRTFSSVRALNSELFPAFVYPAKEMDEKPNSALLSR